MTADIAAETCRAAIFLAMTIAAPVFLAMLATSLVIGLLQAATQMHDQTLSFVPKLIVTAFVILYLLPWSLGRLAEYTTEVIHDVPAAVSYTLTSD
jgi:flagellar biosynthetic protein FliQ